MVYQLRNDQLAILRRLESTIADNRGVLLALPVGSGKTVIALEFARRDGGEALVIGPARLRSHWLRHARAMHVSIRYLSFAWLSRRSPDEVGAATVETRLTIVDETHLLRNPRTRRYRSIARLAQSSRWVLLSATPVVTSADDPITVCAIFDPDAAEFLFGRTSSEASVRGFLLSKLTIAGGPAGTATRQGPVSVERRAVDTARVSETCAQFVRHAVPEHSLRAFYQRLVDRAIASSPAAIEAVVSSCRSLRDRYEEAQASGRGMTRREFYAMFGSSVGDGARAQGVFPWMFSAAELNECISFHDCDRNTMEVCAAELSQFSKVHSAAAQFVHRQERLHPALVYSEFASTVWFLRTKIDRVVARFVDSNRVWSSSSGVHRSSNWQVAEAYGATVVSTDVLSVGVGLPWMRSVVHLEEPRTSALLLQREGRSTRTPDARLQVSLSFRSTSEHGREVSRVFRERRHAAKSFATGTEEAKASAPRRPTLASRPALFHVKHRTVGTTVRDAIRSARRGEDTRIERNPKLWIADDWLTAQNGTKNSCEG